MSNLTNLGSEDVSVLLLTVYNCKFRKVMLCFLLQMVQIKNESDNIL